MSSQIFIGHYISIRISLTLIVFLGSLFFYIFVDINVSHDHLSIFINMIEDIITSTFTNLITYKTIEVTFDNNYRQLEN